MKMRVFVIYGTASMFSMYFVSYSILSLMGVYAESKSSLAPNSDDDGNSTKILAWYPMWTFDDIIDIPDFNGYVPINGIVGNDRCLVAMVYKPLIYLDRTLVHKNKNR